MVAVNGSEHETSVKAVMMEVPEQEKGAATEVTKQEKAAIEATKGGVAVEASKQEMMVMEMAKVGATKGDESSQANSPFPPLGLPWKTGLCLFVLNLRYFIFYFFFCLVKYYLKNIFGMEELIRSHKNSKSLIQRPKKNSLINILELFFFSKEHFDLKIKQVCLPDSAHLNLIF